MGIFTKLFGSKFDGGDSSFMSESEFVKNREKQIAGGTQTLAELRKYGVTNASHLSLEYFFYTNTREKAASLAKKLSQMGYSAEYRHSASDKKLILVTGWTSKIKMDDDTLLDWIGSMCDIGQENDCDFDGWGTTPE